MENLKHTEGKWKVSYSSSHSSHQTFDVDMRNPKHEEMAANAKLISVAPDLLKSMIELKKSMDETIKWQNGGLKHLSQAEQDRYKIICDSINNATK